MALPGNVRTPDGPTVRKAYRLWHRGYTIMTDRRPLDLLRTTLTAPEPAAHAAGTYEVAELNTSDTGGTRQIALQFLWPGPNDKYQVSALLTMRHRARSDRVDWLLAAACTRPWTYRMEAPAVRIGLDLFDSYDTSGLSIRGGHHGRVNSAHPGSGVIADLLVSALKSPERTMNVIVFAHHYTRVTSTRWSGMVGALSVDEGVRAAMNFALPPALQVPVGYRLYAAPCDEQADLISHEGADLTELIARMDSIPHSRRATPLPHEWADDPDLQTWWLAADPFTFASTQEDSGDRGRLTSELAELRKSLTIAQTSLNHATHQREHDAATIAALREQVAAQASASVDGLRAEIEQLHTLLAQCDQDLAEVEAERDDLIRRNNELLRDLHFPDAANQQHVAEPDVGEEIEFTSFPALLNAAATELDFLVITADSNLAASLDHNASARPWRNKVWDALRTLNEYARTRREHREAGTPLPHDLVNALTFARAGRPGTLIAASSIKLSESERVTNNARLRLARTFPVPNEIDPAEHAYFAAHIAISSRAPHPRMYFLDDSDNSGRICIGYIGPHLPNTRTN